MCGIAGILDLRERRVPDLAHRLGVMNGLQSHRGPDGQGVWCAEGEHVGLAHRRLSIIDLDHGGQPMSDSGGNRVTYNGEIYNYIELRRQLGESRFRTTSDTEVLMHAYRKWGRHSLDRLRGMFAFALWDKDARTLFCARDRFGIKPFYYTFVDGCFYFSSEIKALLPFVQRIEADTDGLKDFLTFQFYLEGKTLFRGINELPPGCCLTVHGGRVDVQRYWEVYYDLDWHHTDHYFQSAIYDLLNESVDLHLRSDVAVSSYLSGGLDSSIVATLAARRSPEGFAGYVGKFEDRPGYDESSYARIVAEHGEFALHEISIQPADFLEHIRKLIYHLDQPIAGPGSFPQYMVSQLAARRHKVVLGGQGGDEIFGGYARYLIAYFEQCIKGAIDGTIDNGNFIVTYESIIPNLTTLRQYKPLLKQFWREGLFEELDKRYFRLVNRAPLLGNEVNWEALGDYSPEDAFCRLFNSENVHKESYFDLMTHFDFKTLLPALLHVEDRVSMAHGLESRVPLLDHPLIEMAATIPSNIKFKDGTLKNLLRNVFRPHLPQAITDRKDKMGFPVPLNDWIRGPASDFVQDIFRSRAALSREFIDNRRVLERLAESPSFDRTIWGLLCLELWQQEFVDRQAEFQRLLKHPATSDQTTRVAA